VSALSFFRHFCACLGISLCEDLAGGIKVACFNRQALTS
jgi:hypothetical protein